MAQCEAAPEGQRVSAFRAAGGTTAIATQAIDLALSEDPRLESIQVGSALIPTTAAQVLRGEWLAVREAAIRALQAAREAGRRAGDRVDLAAGGKGGALGAGVRGRARGAPVIRVRVPDLTENDTQDESEEIEWNTGHAPQRRAVAGRIMYTPPVASWPRRDSPGMPRPGRS